MPLDVTTNAVLGISLRKLRTDYTGSAIRVRRSSDDTEQDIGFTGNELDTTSLLSFVGSNNGFIRTWYDQSTNANNYNQPLTANQPQIVDTGSLILDNNGKPTVLFNGSSHWMDGVHQDIINVLLGSSIFVVGQGDPTTGRYFFNEGRTSSNNTIVSLYQSGGSVRLSKSQFFRNDANGPYYSITTLGTIDPLIPVYDIYSFGLKIDGANSERYAFVNGLEGVNSPVVLAGNGTVTTNRHTIGALGRAGITVFFKINLNELLWYSDYKRSDATSISNLINSYYNLY